MPYTNLSFVNEENANEGHMTFVLRGSHLAPECLFESFVPSEIVLNKLFDSFTRVFEMAPSQTTLEARIDCQKSEFKFQLILNYGSGKMKAIATSSHLIDGLNNLLDQIYMKIAQWRSERFIIDDLTNDVTKIQKNRSRTDTRLRDGNVQRPQILIVDDNPISIKLIESCFQQLGCEIKSVTSGIEAIEQVTKCDYDLLVLDWQMPDLSGPETLRGAQDMISFDAGFRLPWMTHQLRVMTYSGDDIVQENFPKCANFEFIGHVPKSSRYADLQKRTSEVIKSLNVA